MAKGGQHINISGTLAGEFTTDKNLLKNILINLLSNAVKFSPEHSTIELAVLLHPGNLMISVADRGIGIAHSDQQQLFTSFFRAGNATNIQGSGLGLHIVKRYLDLLQGHITVESELNKGTTFTMTLPDLRSEAAL